MSDQLKNKLWVEKHRPQSIRDYIFQNEKYKAQINQMIAEQNIPHILLSGVQGSGKAQPLDAKVLTPSGWIAMGDVVPGTIVRTPSGDIASVTSIHPQGYKDIYAVTFHDGSSTECCADHLWTCWMVENFNNRKQVKKTISTKELLEYLETPLGKQFNVSVDLVKPVEYDIPNSSVSIDPYVLGVLIGDGTLTSSVRFTSTDEEIVRYVREALGDEYIIKSLDGVKEWSISDTAVINHGGELGRSKNRIRSNLESYGLWNMHSHEKFIPASYKLLSVFDRISLLQGLFDTDGTISKRGIASFTTTSAKLALDVREILWSLGATCSMSTRQPTYQYNGKKHNGRIAYELRFNHPNGTKQFFRLARKKDRALDKFANNHNKGEIQLRRRIQSIIPVGQKEAQCIMIDHPDHLYVTDDFITTHNTTLALILIQALNIQPSDVKIINASDENSVDTVREKIKEFASTAPMGKFKIILLEEADHISGPAQAALRRVMEENSDTTRFILTCNYKYKITPPIQSRCTAKYNFKSPDKDDIAEYLINVLAREKVTFDLDLLDKYIAAGYPDIRDILGALQQNTVDGVLQHPDETSTTNEDYKFKLLDFVEQDKWVDARKLICSTVSREEYDDVYRFLYENINRSKKFQNKDIWEEAILVISEHMYKHISHPDPEINAAAMFIKLGQLK